MLLSKKLSDYGGLYLDRILAHELTHGAMVANITATSELPVFFREGAAELVHGADDYRSSDMLRIIKDSFRLTNDNGNYTASQRESLEAVYSMTNANSATSARYSYSAGYSLLRYFAKQVYDEYNNVSPVTAANNSELMNAVLDFAEPTVLSSLDCHQEENLKLQIAGQSN